MIIPAQKKPSKLKKVHFGYLIKDFVLCLVNAIAECLDPLFLLFLTLSLQFDVRDLQANEQKFPEMISFLIKNQNGNLL